MKNQKKLFGFFIFIFLVCACDQNTLGMGAAIKNFITLPIQGVKSLANVVSGKTYEAYKEKTRENDTSAVICTEQSEGQQLNNLIKVACKCEPWAYCRKELCSCEIMCPSNFNIFKRPNISIEPTPENTLSFINSPSAFKDYEMTQGYCWGHAAITQRFNRLGFFSPIKTPTYLGKSIVESKDPESWKNFYSNIIDKISSNEAVEIPGFANLGEFSSHPVIQEMLADRVAQTWASHAMSFNGLSSALGTSAMTKKETQDLIKNIKERLSYNQSPQLIMTAKDSAFYTHVVLVSGIKEVGGETRICLNDNNYPAKMNSNCQHYLKVTQAGDIIYPKSAWYGTTMGRIDVTANEDSDTVTQVASLTKYCRGQKDCDGGI